MKTTCEEIKKHHEAFCLHLTPYGYLDIRRAVEVAFEIGEGGDWAAEQVLAFQNEYECSISEIDPVYVVYEAVLQEARSEIFKHTGFDFLNDNAEVCTFGNYVATGYDWYNDAPTVISEKLKKHKISLSNLSLKTQWFLRQIL